ncbi:AP-4 complex accessory subunit RUSC1 [Hyla sarda]|uniref:AP-4 complex accessory subunit RUSC1 n=1 Tax=Hyla sarda TaxID=327740 RepID=UPI0024C2471C|nr:AP-4 complex accessory subunit RUSC1 [Hyla sarda]
MLASRKALLSNLNYVHLQHVSLGVHLSMHPEMTESSNNPDTGVKDLCHDKWKDTIMEDPNSNDPSMPCQCCDQCPRQKASLQYSSLEDLDTIICEECLSPDDLPLSPLSLSSPSTDSSSSSDFTLDDSPASMYYKEYSQDGLDTPDQQPDIIPLDDPVSPGALCLSLQKNETTFSSNSETNNNMEKEDTPFIDWGSDSLVDSNTLIERSGSSSMDSDTIAEPDVLTNKTGQAGSTCAEPWLQEHDLLQLPIQENTSTLTPKKTITSFHELALRRKRSGGQLPSQPKKDRSDWLIIFSPDTEQPPINELTASAFYHEILETQNAPISAGKGVTTFRELRYRNALNKQSVQHMKVDKERLGKTSTEATIEHPHIEVLRASWKPKNSQQLLATKTEWENATTGEWNDQRQEPQCFTNPACTDDAYIPSGRDHAQLGLGNSLPAIRKTYSRHEEISDKKVASTTQVAWIRGMADGGDRRGQEAAGTFSSCNVLLRAPHLRPFYLYAPVSPLSSGPDYPHPIGSAQQPWYPGIPPRLSPVGASSPPHRTLLPLLNIPDVAVLLSPMFPRKRTLIRLTRGHEAAADPRDTGAECELFMEDDTEDSAERQKKNFLIAVGSSVEKIICHFNTSRNQVQKAQLGDSRLSPVLGYLILNHLCPSLYSLLSDGLKPYQKDVIIGRRRLSPWSLVEASMKTGPGLVHLLFSKVNRLTQLRDPQRKFNAFIFGLLNMKQLDVWVLHLHQIYNHLSIFYLPIGFLPLAATSHVELRDELLLSLQPLSALTFHTDLLFEHHHLSLQDLPTPHSVHSPGHMTDNWAVPSLQNMLDLGGWITYNLSWNTEKKAPSPNKEKSLDSPEHKLSTERSRTDNPVVAGDCPHAGDTSVLPGDTTQPSSFHTVTKELMTANKETSPGQTPSRVLTRNWWGHLSQASRIYIPANRESLTFTSFSKPTSWGPMDKELNQRAASSKNFSEQRLAKDMTSGGVSETTSKEIGQQKQQMDTKHNNLGSSSNTASTQGPLEGNSCSAGPDQVEDLCSTGQHLNSEGKGNWLGQLFGASSSQIQGMEARNSISRRPSSWLTPNVNVRKLIRKQTIPLKHEEEEPSQRDHSRAQRSLRALCDHMASGEAQLSFKKGDVLQLLGTVDEDWIQCRRGSDTGLVPVGYTSLIL